MGRDVADVILIVDSNGVVSNVYARVANPKALCFIGALLGKQLPIPPFSPMPIRMFIVGE
jgi:hypothetical protein